MVGAQYKNYFTVSSKPTKLPEINVLCTTFQRSLSLCVFAWSTINVCQGATPHTCQSSRLHRAKTTRFPASRFFIFLFHNYCQQYKACSFTVSWNVLLAVKNVVKGAQKRHFVSLQSLFSNTLETSNVWQKEMALLFPSPEIISLHPCNILFLQNFFCTFGFRHCCNF